MNQDIAEKLTIARSRLLLDHPFFGSLSLKLTLIEDPSIPTLATNGVYIKYNPTFIDETPMNLCSSALAHEVMHCVLEHMFRREGRDPERWNVACDYALNPILKEAGLLLGPDWLYKHEWAQLSADEIYLLLPQNKPKTNSPGPSTDPGGEQTKPFNGRGALCEVHDAPQGDGVGEGEGMSDDLITEWKLATVQAAKAQEQYGSLPGRLRKMLDNILAPEIDWKQVLAQYMAERVKDDYSFRRPNPYYTHTGIYLPVMDSVGMGELVIGLDTSGSVVNIIDEFGATVRDIVNTTRPARIHVVYCDANVNRVDVFERGQTLTFEAVGGGGTDFRPVFDYVKNNSIDPACLLYLTDMYGSFPQEAPQYPVVWCATSDLCGPFGETLRIKE